MREQECRACGAYYWDDGEFCHGCIKYRDQVTAAAKMRALADREDRRRKFFGDINPPMISR